MNNGNFSGAPKTEWLTQPDSYNREMKLLEDFWYEDPKGKRWLASKDSIVNGASIPQALWSSIGSPYTGNYRRASIVHDIACTDPAVDRKNADKMFYFACLAGGCSLQQAKMLYAGVRIGAWASSAGIRAKVYEVDPRTYRLPNQYTENELELRAKFILIAKRLETTPDDFNQIQQAVDGELIH